MLFKINKPKMSKNNFRKLLKLSTSDVQFSFNSQIYSQSDGIAMGSPLGPTLTNIFMDFIEAKVVYSFKYRLRYFRYVDECFVLVKSGKDIDEFFTIFNLAQNATKFTIEKEFNNELGFLDILVKRQKNRMFTSDFRKKNIHGQLSEFSIKLQYEEENIFN